MLGWNKAGVAGGARIKKNAPRIISEWNYRPRIAIRRYAAANSAGADTFDLLSQERFAINDNVWLNNGSRECAAYAFINLDPAGEDATTKAPLPDHESAVSMYD